MTNTEVIARRKSFDGVTVKLWSDGAVTLGINLLAADSRTRSSYETQKNVDAGWLAMGEVELYDAAEVRKLVQTARVAVRQASLEPLRYLRQSMAGAKFQAIKKGRVVQHRRTCDCIRCVKERLACGGTGDTRKV